MKKRVFLLAGLMVLVLNGCGNKSSEPPTTDDVVNEINQMIQEEEDAREAEQEEIQNQAEQQNEYIEGIIPAGRYYKEGDTSNTCWTFYMDSEGNGCFTINQKSTIGTYTYDSETGIYSLEYMEGTIERMDHFIYEGYIKDEGYILVVTKSAIIEDDTEYILNDEEREFIRIE